MRSLGAIELEIQALAGRQHGVVARRQLLRPGLGAAAIHHRLTNGRLVPLQRGVYALGHVELRREGHTLGVVLRYGDAAAVSHRSATAVWGIRP